MVSNAADSFSKKMVSFHTLPGPTTQCVGSAQVWSITDLTPTHGSLNGINSVNT